MALPRLSSDLSRSARISAGFRDRIASGARGTLGSMLVAAALLVTAPAAAQVEGDLTALNTEALEAYQNLDIDAAKAKLEQAVDIATQAGFAGPELAQVFMTLGVVHVAGASDTEQGLAAFTNAICTQPDVQLDPLLSTPEVQQVFMQAQQNAQSGACGPGGATAAPAYVPPPPSDVAEGAYDSSQVEDVECPPGVVCGGEDGEGGDRGPSDFARFFFNIQFTLGLPFVQPGMPADSKPSFEEIFTTVDVPTDADMDGIQDDANMDGVGDFETRYYFDDKSGWVPDADSFDDFEFVDQGRVVVPRGATPVSAQCEGDGTRSGPPAVTDSATGAPFQQLEPSSYCVRVASSGFVPTAALRLNPGYFITDTFALSMPIRIAFNSGEGSMSGLLVGLRGELLFSKMEEATGMPISWFFGATYGQIQAQPPPKDASRAVPFISSGPLGLHTGINWRMRIHRNFGFIVAPEIDLQVPDLLFNIDLSAGVEAAF